MRHMDTNLLWMQNAVKKLGPDVDKVLVTENSADLGANVHAGPDHGKYCQTSSIIELHEFTKHRSVGNSSIAGDAGGLISLPAVPALLCAALPGEIGGTRSLRKA